MINWLWSFIDPIVGQAFWVGVGTLVCIAIGYLIPQARIFTGTVILAGIAYLIGFWSGENAQKERDKNKW